MRRAGRKAGVGDSSLPPPPSSPTSVGGFFSRLMLSRTRWKRCFLESSRVKLIVNLLWYIYAPAGLGLGCLCCLNVVMTYDMMQWMMGLWLTLRRGRDELEGLRGLRRWEVSIYK
ncbi:uncharacterized protein BO72DRAFT_245671 [Aspergillus fijiensis CBS 313.89]|uniref:Transmembrane protein n=1 Tax=Aspergillus fijiensis CBS 313.89 TaxID=1448319 RepID=A0A8G1RJ29_9EURO|nr:uncharacterized protein BO72DRAFT_245671 [Aspergillus fijiensis CBS 313.89]RAK73332.1 hypothetical protein BO72DRAFT_245671 [Aspergillus fijiensis CBS 313.89]